MTKISREKFKTRKSAGTKDQPVKPTSHLRKGGSKPPRLDIILAESERLDRVLNGLVKGVECPLAYPTLADAGTIKVVISEITRQLVDMLRTGDLVGLNTSYHFDPAHESSGVNAWLSMKKIRKVAAQIKRNAPDSISLVVFAPAPTHEADPGWNHCAMIATLELLVRAETAKPSRSRPIARTGAAQHGPRPSWSPGAQTDLTEKKIHQIVCDFMGVQGRLRREFGELARASKHPSWRATTDARLIGDFSVRAMTPLNASMFSSGRGDVVLRVAQTQPTARAKGAKTQGGLDRAQLAHALWTFTYEKRLAPPPFVEI